MHSLIINCLFPGLMALFLAVFHIGVGLVLWWYNPESVSFATLAVVEFLVALGELGLVFRVDHLPALLGSWRIRPTKEGLRKLGLVLVGVVLVYDLSMKVLKQGGVFKIGE